MKFKLWLSVRCGVLMCAGLVGSLPQVQAAPDVEGLDPKVRGYQPTRFMRAALWGVTVAD